jgi:hypothetical protein
VFSNRPAKPLDLDDQLITRHCIQIGVHMPPQSRFA